MHNLTEIEKEQIVGARMAGASVTKSALNCVMFREHRIKDQDGIQEG